MDLPQKHNPTWTQSLLGCPQKKILRIQPLDTQPYCQILFPCTRRPTSTAWQRCSGGQKGGEGKGHSYLSGKRGQQSWETFLHTDILSFKENTDTVILTEFRLDQEVWQPELQVSLQFLPLSWMGSFQECQDRNGLWQTVRLGICLILLFLLVILCGRHKLF